ncbi:hypothetical protein H6G76_05400 [Nostoc sp. FACHB-152]|uniref:hypothetical protein n=1 Tax=unclassified Nostoc TaxID=2593658 RepID=UPI001682B05D|nr:MULTISPECIES: hypothetical protein [unclassified Nostoc]MBD2446607.1 hypothetical protein [Nostoc sp. FACHB-152]MBD2466455.1 hypothetical protein [Nostoc sp. FACHB-145]
MINQPHISENFAHPTSQVELELLEVLLESEDAAYPWNPADEEAEAYFTEVERQFCLQDLLEEELHTRAQSFYGKLDTLWSEVTNLNYEHNTKNNSILNSLQASLHNSFASKIPYGWLDAIAQKAAEIFKSQQSVGEQLVECVQAVLPSWGADDLSVFARPYAYAMRSSESKNLDAIISNVESKDWTSLSEIEQAKLSVAIAYYALKQLELQTEA